jgi:hypothetical protein
MPYRQRAAEILAAWRAAERAREETAEGTPERESIDHEIDRLRREYHDLIDLQRTVHGPPIPEEPLTKGPLASEHPSDDA